jgi:hypothetical protein
MIHHHPYHRPSSRSKSTSTNNGWLLFVAFVTFCFVLLKIPMELKVTSRAASSSQRLTIDDLYNKKAPRSAIDRRIIDAKRSYHFFNRKRNDMSPEQIRKDQELAHEVDKIMRYHSVHDDPEDEERRNLRSGVDKTTTKNVLSDRALEVMKRYLPGFHTTNLVGRNDGTAGAMKKGHVGGIPHERKEEDPYDIEITKEIRDIMVKQYHDPDDI